MSTRRKTINYVRLEHGRCGLTTETRAEVIKQQGTHNVSFVRPATQAEVAWVRGMGGNVPDGVVYKPRATKARDA